MPLFKKGNPGRPKGSKNKTTQARKDILLEIVEHIETHYLESDLEKLSPKERMRVYMAAQEYLIPKLQRSEIEGDLGDIEKFLELPEETRRNRLYEIKAKIDAKKKKQKSL
ncbi:hypothetical protein WJR50_32910 [Catalinimonas sp. 4WD22]|uniref:hypothetical protein n=1 Tax=Catalinimonas locisalis TaxID=3133978 RepID=UPI003100F206